MLLRAEQGRHDPHNFLAQRSYAQSLNRVGTVLLALRRDVLTAAGDFREAAAISQRFLAIAPSDYRVLSALARSYRGEAEVELRLRKPAIAAGPSGYLNRASQVSAKRGSDARWM